MPQGESADSTAIEIGNTVLSHVGLLKTDIDSFHSKQVHDKLLLLLKAKDQTKTKRWMLMDADGLPKSEPLSTEQVLRDLLSQSDLTEQQRNGIQASLAGPELVLLLYCLYSPLPTPTHPLILFGAGKRPLARKREDRGVWLRKPFRWCRRPDVRVQAERSEGFYRRTGTRRSCRVAATPRATPGLGLYETRGLQFRCGSDYVPLR